MINLVENLNFHDEEIAAIENLFFGEQHKFNIEQKAVINCFSKENIQACPGSGKTTTLAAKLLLLKNRIGKNVQGGVCILTHTNVAVDIIRERLGAEGAAFYSSYPNYLGTIQSFVNKFLAIPAYKQEFGKSVEAIDDDVFYKLIEKKTKFYASNASLYLSKSKGIDHLGTLSYNINNFDISLKIDDTEPVVGTHTTSYQQLVKLKAAMLSQGYLKYIEAYAMAYKYLREHPSIVPLFSKRFPLVFLDEMQDTEKYQFSLIAKLFGDNSVLQTIGDGNQDIFGHYEEIRSGWPTSLSFSITTSSRFPQHLADILDKVAVEQQSIKGNLSKDYIKPHIIIYNDETILNVKEKFAEIIFANDLHRRPDAIFKAVGARKNENLSIASYYPEYNKSGSKIKDQYPAMADYIEMLSLLKEGSSNLKGIKDLLLSIIIHTLRIVEVKDNSSGRYFTASSLERFLKIENLELYQKLRAQLENSCQKFLLGNDLRAELKYFVINVILPYFNVANTVTLTIFLNAEASVLPNNTQSLQNQYKWDYEGETVNILFDTLHSAKGETHTATLYLETYTRTYDIPKLLPLMSGKQNRVKSYINSNKSRMKEGFVAMSRPTDLLAIAVHTDRIDLETDWNALGYKIVK